MVFIILVGATAFGPGDALIHDVVDQLALPNWAIFACIMGVVFLLGFFLDYIEIAFIHLPVIAPILSAMGFDPLWYGVLLGVNLQTSFLTPPFGFALFYFRGVAPSRATTGQIYRGIIPFVIIQIIGLMLVAFYPEVATWLPRFGFNCVNGQPAVLAASTPDGPDRSMRCYPPSNLYRCMRNLAPRQ